MEGDSFQNLSSDRDNPHPFLHPLLKLKESTPRPQPVALTPKNHNANKQNAVHCKQSTKVKDQGHQEPQQNTVYHKQSTKVKDEQELEQSAVYHKQSTKVKGQGHQESDLCSDPELTEIASKLRLLAAADSDADLDETTEGEKKFVMFVKFLKMHIR